MINYDKEEIKRNLTQNNIYSLLVEWGGNPTLNSSYIVSDTICHNHPGEGSHKLYYYFNTNLFRCYTGCEEPSFDIFELCIKVSKIQNNEELDLNSAVRKIANYFGIVGTREDNEYSQLQDWQILDTYDRVQSIEPTTNDIVLKEYDKKILDRFNYNVRILPWEKDNISKEVMKIAMIGYYPGGDQITIPHFDINNRFVGLRGRALCVEEAERYGKYRPIKVNGTLYNHPLGMNLYGINLSKNNIRAFGKAIVFESEKSVLQYLTMFNEQNNIAVACCGSNLSQFQMEQLRKCGAKEVIIAYDRQYKEINDDEYLKWLKKLKGFKNKFSSDITISFILDKEHILGYKDSPIETNKENFIELLKNRIILTK